MLSPTISIRALLPVCGIFATTAHANAAPSFNPHGGARTYLLLSHQPSSKNDGPSKARQEVRAVSRLVSARRGAAPVECIRCADRGDEQCGTPAHVIKVLAINALEHARSPLVLFSVLQDSKGCSDAVGLPAALKMDATSGATCE